VNVHGYIEVENYENVGENIGNYFSVYFWNLGLCISEQKDFKIDITKSNVLENLPFIVKYKNDPVYSKYVKKVYNNFIQNGIDSKFIKQKQADSLWFIDDEKNILFWDAMKPFIQKIFDDMFTKSKLNIQSDCPVIHFRCADVPFAKHFHYHLVKYEFYKKALEIIQSKTGRQYNKVILLSCNTHNSSDENKKTCNIYVKTMVDYLNSIGYEVDVQCNSNIDDFAKLYYAPAVISNVSSFAIISGYFGKGIFVCSENNIESNKGTTCSICNDWMIKGYQIKHKLIDNYYDTENVINNFLL
jgi:hypothetical protein